MVPAYAESLHGLRAIYIDTGTRDQYYLEPGTPLLGVKAGTRA
jgi:hypothetical protein